MAFIAAIIAPSPLVRPPLASPPPPCPAEPSHKRRRSSLPGGSASSGCWAASCLMRSRACSAHPVSLLLGTARPYPTDRKTYAKDRRYQEDPEQRSPEGKDGKA